MGWCMACSRQGPLDGCGRGEHGSVVNLKCPSAALKQHCCVLPTRATIAQNWFAASRLREDFLGSLDSAGGEKYPLVGVTGFRVITFFSCVRPRRLCRL